MRPCWPRTRPAKEVVGTCTWQRRSFSASIKVASESHQQTKEIPLGDLLKHLPPVISYSPLNIALPSGHEIRLSRRDLFDARFQLISESDVDAGTPAALECFDAPSDLSPGVYEGGLKTWECSLDLVRYLHAARERGAFAGARGKRIIEVGCGTAIPSLYLLHEMFGEPHTERGETRIHLQDYNAFVLQLITLPNILLAWYTSLASASYRASQPSAPTPDSGELEMTPSLVEAFLESLSAHAIVLKFHAGPWETFDVGGLGGAFDLVLTSETIYRPESLPSLITLLRACCEPEYDRDAGRDSTEDSTSSPSAPTHRLCLVAAKVLYFGVGGGVSDFSSAVEEHHGGKAEMVWESNKPGVGRKIMSVSWE